VLATLELFLQGLGAWIEMKMNMSDDKGDDEHIDEGSSSGGILSELPNIRAECCATSKSMHIRSSSTAHSKTPLKYSIRINGGVR
jgi:hypothetical protein